MGNKLGKVYLIDVILVMSLDDGQSFPLSLTVTDAPWDPGVDAPLSHGQGDTSFIGDYFGLGVSDEGFYPFWTDTRTGRQDIFVSRVALMAPGEVPRRIIDGAVLQILFGVTADGGGKGLTGSGGVVIVPPRQPVRDLLYSLAIYELGRAMQDGAEGAKLEAAAMHAISEAAQKQALRLQQGKAGSPALSKPTRRKPHPGRRRNEKA